MGDNNHTAVRNRLFRSDTLLTIPVDRDESVNLYLELRAISDKIRRQENVTENDLRSQIKKACKNYILCGNRSRIHSQIFHKRNVIRVNAYKGCVLTALDEQRTPMPNRLNRARYPSAYKYIDLDMYIAKSMNNAVPNLRPVDQENDGIIHRTLQNEEHLRNWYAAQAPRPRTIATARRMLVFRSQAQGMDFVMYSATGSAANIPLVADAFLGLIMLSDALNGRIGVQRFTPPEENGRGECLLHFTSHGWNEAPAGGDGRTEESLRNRWNAALGVTGDAFNCSWCSIMRENRFEFLGVQFHICNDCYIGRSLLAPRDAA